MSKTQAKKFSFKFVPYLFIAVTILTHFCNYLSIKVFFFGDSFMISNIMLYLRKKIMSKTKAKNLSLKFVPYVFVAVTTLTAFGSNNGIWS